jgi:cysteine-rich repeat protein
MKFRHFFLLPLLGLLLLSLPYSLMGCTSPRCGDGTIQKEGTDAEGNALNEEGDDGNRNDNDFCTNACKLAKCGDGIVQIGIESCDDGNKDDKDGCTTKCKNARCGDGFVQKGKEECDDGNKNDNDSCLNTCKKARCGDGILWAGVEACDDGNQNHKDACRNNCISATCGDGKVQQGREECDDSNRDNTDGCLVNCMAFDPCAGFAISELKPAVACIKSIPNQLTIVGTGFLRVNGKLPTVTLDNKPLTVRSLTQCVPLQGKFERIDRCQTIVVALPSGLTLGNYQIAVRNAVTKQCKVTAMF